MPNPPPPSPSPSPGTAVAQPTDFVRKVGRGKTLARDLEYPEAVQAFGLLLDGRFTAAQAGAFLQALRIKELNAPELDGLLAAFYTRMLPLPAAPSAGFALNLASDTGRKGGLLSLLAARVLAAAGLPVALVRSDPMLTGNQNSWDATWAAWTPPPSAPAPSLFAVYAMLPALRPLRELRRELGFRSCLHTAEKMLQPWPGRPLVLGISHRHYAERMAGAMRRRGLWGKIVLGNHGTPDLVLHKETEIWEVSAAGDIGVISVHPDALGLHPDPGLYALGAFDRWPEACAQSDFGWLRPALEYQLAFLRYAAGVAPDPVAGAAGIDAVIRAACSQTMLTSSLPGDT